jgi:tetratricopeptide (TPR) repeat protein
VYASNVKILLYLIVVSTILLLSVCIPQSVSTEQLNIDDYVETLNMKGKALDELGKYEEAIEYYDKVLALDPNNKFALNNKGADLYDLGSYEEAIKYFLKRLAIDPNNKHVLYNTGTALDELGRYVEAIEYYDRALAIDPNFLKALINKGLSLKKLGIYEEAIKYYDRALAIDPNNKFALQNRANALTASGKYQEAIQRYGEALAINPNDIDTLNNIGAAFAESGGYLEAIKYYDRALAIDPNNSIALNNKAAALIELGMYEEAKEFYNKILPSKEVLDISPHYHSLKNDPEALYDQNQANVYLVENGENRGYSNTDLGMKINKIFLEQALLLTNLDRLGESNSLHYIAVSAISRSGDPGSIDIVANEIRIVNQAILTFKSGIDIESAKRTFVSGLASDKNKEIYVACNYYIGLYLELDGKHNEAMKYKSKAKSLDKGYDGDPIIIQTDLLSPPN